MRKLYVVAPDTEIDDAVIAAATAAGSSEIVRGIPPSVVLDPPPAFPFVYTEPDDPHMKALHLSAAVLRNTYGTTRTAAQVDNCLDAISVILRRIAQIEMDR